MLFSFRVSRNATWSGPVTWLGTCHGVDGFFEVYTTPNTGSLVPRPDFDLRPLGLVLVVFSGAASRTLYRIRHAPSLNFTSPSQTKVTLGSLLRASSEGSILLLRTPLMELVAPSTLSVQSIYRSQAYLTCFVPPSTFFTPLTAYSALYLPGCFAG